MTVTDVQIKQVGNEPTEVSDGINVELLQKVLKYIQEHPQTWRQDDWYMILDENGWTPHLVSVEYEEINSCGSAMCFAGHAALMEGFPAPPKYGPWNRRVENEDGSTEREDVPEFARKRLGLSFDVAEELFDASNTMENLEDMVKYLIECADEDKNPNWEVLSDIRDESDDYYGEDDE